MKQRAVMELIDAQKMMAAAEAEAKKNAWKVTIAIVDEGGHIILQMRMDGAVPMSTLIAPEKARASVLSRKPSKAFEDMVNKRSFRCTQNAGRSFGRRRNDCGRWRSHRRSGRIGCGFRR